MSRITVVALACLVAACAGDRTDPVAPAASGPARMQGSSISNYPFYNCSGPAGTPTSFTGRKVALPPSAPYPVAPTTAYRLAQDTRVFIVFDFGLGEPRRDLDNQADAVVTCTIDFRTEGRFTVRGFLTPP
jgi:hypothetical protein